MAIPLGVLAGTAIVGAVAGTVVGALSRSSSRKVGQAISTPPLSPSQTPPTPPSPAAQPAILNTREFFPVYYPFAYPVLPDEDRMICKKIEDNQGEEVFECKRARTLPRAITPMVRFFGPMWF